MHPIPPTLRRRVTAGRSGGAVVRCRNRWNCAPCSCGEVSGSRFRRECHDRSTEMDAGTCHEKWKASCGSDQTLKSPSVTTSEPTAPLPKRRQRCMSAGAFVRQAGGPQAVSPGRPGLAARARDRPQCALIGTGLIPISSARVRKSECQRSCLRRPCRVISCGPFPG
jgi:hypothetical protein